MKPQRTTGGAFRKGASGNPQGRPKGSPNKITERIRETIHSALDATSDEVAGWMHTLGKDDPKAALQVYAALAEFVLPKLSRVDGRTAKDDEPIVIQFVDPPACTSCGYGANATAYGSPNDPKAILDDIPPAR